jgi:hypothetical protein
VRRRRTFRRNGRITRQAVEAFQRGDDEALRLELRLKPWEISPLSVEDDEPCCYPEGSAGALSWPECLALRRELKELASELDPPS